MYSIEIENLTKKFKEKTAVNNVSLKIKQGELFSLNFLVKFSISIEYIFTHLLFGIFYLINPQ